MKENKSVYQIIKKQNGEKFAQSIRRYDSGIFDVENLDKIVAHAGRDAGPILPFLEGLKYAQLINESGSSERDFATLLHQAGYDFIVADTLQKQNSIRHYFAPREELCTFKDDDRFERYHIVHLIRKDAHLLNREDFRGRERREDEYATSVLSIQMLKSGGFIKICNRYNHSVQNPDNTFNSNPDKIVMGLSDALKKHFNIEFQVGEVPLPEYFIYINGMLYNYHTECDGVYFGDGFYILDEKVKKVNPDYQMIVDNFIIDFKKNEILTVHQLNAELFAEDSILPLIKMEIEGKKLSRQKKKNFIHVFIDDTCFLKSEYGKMRFLNLKKPTSAKTIFVHHPWIEEVYLDNLEACFSTMGPSFSHCDRLRVLSLKSLKTVEEGSISVLPELQKIYLNSATILEKEVLKDLKKLGELSLPNVEVIHDFSMTCNKNLLTISLPRVIEVGAHSLNRLKKLIKIDMPLVRKMWGCNLMYCHNLESVDLPKVEVLGSGSLSKNKRLKRVSLPSVLYVFDGVLSENPGLENLILPVLKSAGRECFSFNNSMDKVRMPLIENVGAKSFTNNPELKVAFLPQVQTLGADCFFANPHLKWVFLNSFEKGHANLFLMTGAIEHFFAPKWQSGEKNVRLLNRHVRFLKPKKNVKERE